MARIVLHSKFVEENKAYILYLYNFFFRKSNDTIKSDLKIASKLLDLNVDVEVDEVLAVQYTGERSDWRHSLVGKNVGRCC